MWVIYNKIIDDYVRDETDHVKFFSEKPITDCPQKEIILVNEEVNERIYNLNLDKNDNN